MSRLPSVSLTIDGKVAEQPNGPVLVTVRPEDVQLRPAADSQNQVGATVTSSVYMGTHTQVQLEVDGHPWQAQTSAHTPAVAGASIMVELPEKSIWLLPANE